MDLLNIPEEIAARITGETGEVLDLIAGGFVKVAALLDALSARIAALEHHGESPPAP